MDTWFAKCAWTAYSFPSHFEIMKSVGILFTALAMSCGAVLADDVTFFSYSDSHYGATGGGRWPPTRQSHQVGIINALPGVVYPAEIGGVVDVPRAILMQGDLINDGAVAKLYPTQWKNYLADFGVNGEGRCKFPVFEGVGNHDVNTNLFVFDQVKKRNIVRKQLGFIGDVSANGYHYSWDWDGVHFVNVNLFPGNAWEGEADAYGRGHHPQFARDFLIEDLKKNVGDSGRPVVVMQHFRVVDENWWTYSAADKFHQVLQDYNVVAILVGHQGGGVNNLWRGYNWISSNGKLVVCQIKDRTFSAVTRSDTGWERPMQKKIFYSYVESGLPA
ncbi:MAG: cytolysin (calcineurin-like family phosphatase), partial [Pseudoalteromonas tetraodonis]